MKQNHSPWLYLLNRQRPAKELNKDIKTDVAIVGGGIAGVTTAYFILRNTDKKVVLIEAGKIAHGATGHNAGYLASYFERSFGSLVDEYGLDLAARAQRGVESSWELLDEIKQYTGIKTPMQKFTGHAGCTTVDQIKQHLHTNLLRKKAGLKNEHIFIASELGLDKKIPSEYDGLYLTMPHKDILSVLETKNTKYIGLVSYQKGLMNSAMFSEELICFLVEKFSSRFEFYEESPVKVIALVPDKGSLTVLNHTVEANKVVLCTNGFDGFTIVNQGGLDIDTKFHHMVQGKIGYMVGYLESPERRPAAISYRTEPSAETDERDITGEPYYYLTRRPHHTSQNAHSLVSIGGPEEELPNRSHYLAGGPFAEERGREMAEFLSKNYHGSLPKADKFEFAWHGLMGYTPSGIRRVGPEPLNPVLLYNLGCNGIGILPSVYASQRISMFVKGVPMKPSIFDPVDQRHHKPK